MSAGATGSGWDPDAGVSSPPLGPTADSDVVLLQEHLAAAGVDIPGASDALRLDSLPLDVHAVFGPG